MSSGINMDFVFGRADKAARDARDVTEPGQLFRVMVVGDFSGRASRRAEHDAAPTFVPVRVDIDNIDSVFERLAPRLSLPVPGSAQDRMHLSLKSLEDFEPDALFVHLPLFSQLRDLRARLAHPATFEQAAAELRAHDAAASPPAQVSAAAPVVAEDDTATLQRLLGVAPTATAAPVAASLTAQSAVDRLIRQIVAPHVVPDTAHLQQPLLDSLDRAIGESLRSLLCDPHFRALEGAWRAVDQFVRSVEMDGQVLLELVDASAADVLGSLLAAEGDAARLPLARTLEARRRHEGQEEGYALIVGLYEFGCSAQELALLAGLGALAAREGAAFVGAAAASLAGVDAVPVWSGVMPVTSDAAALARWNALRASWVAPHIALVWPRVMGRLPYGARTQPVAAFKFEELAEPHHHDQLPWRLAALDAAASLARRYTESGWALDTHSAAEIDDLPAFTDRSGDGPRLQAVAEFFMSEAQAQALGALGIMPLVSHRSLPHARLGGWRSISATAPALQGPWQE